MKKLLEIVKSLLEDTLVELGFIGNTIKLVFPNDSTNGDFCTNIALTQAKKISRKPILIANEIKKKLEEKGLPKGISKVEVAGIGFINFYFSTDFFMKQIKIINDDQSSSFGKSSIYLGKRILVEHSSPNLFKPFHIGHVMNNVIGESITRLARYSGAEVTEISYPSDVSLGIGKAVYIIMLDGISKLDSFQTEEEKLAYLGECYIRGTKIFEEDKGLEIKIRDISKKIYNGISSVELDIYKKGKEISLSYFMSMTKRLGSSFDAYIFESEAGEEGEKIVREHIGDIFVKSEGAIVYIGEEDGLHTRVFINKTNDPTYEAKDVGLLSLKFKRYNPDFSIFVTDSQQTRYFEVVASAAGKIEPIWKEKTIHRTHGRMSFKGNKMSSRLGGVPIASVVLDAIAEEIFSRVDNLDRKLIEEIALASLKFDILRVTAGKNINFDPDTSLSFEGDSGPYLQYTTVRTMSVLSKAKKLNLLLTDFPEDSNLLINDIAKILIHFPRIVELAISEWAPHYLVSYLVELAHAFNSWYGNTRIIDQTNPMLIYNLQLTNAVNIVMKNGLWILGIEVPEKM